MRDIDNWGEKVSNGKRQVLDIILDTVPMLHDCLKKELLCSKPDAQLLKVLTDAQLSFASLLLRF